MERFIISKLLCRKIHNDERKYDNGVMIDKQNKEKADCPENVSYIYTATYFMTKVILQKKRTISSILGLLDIHILILEI